MKIKKYIDSDITLLMNKVKSELGEDAVIISTSNIDDGKTELVAAAETADVFSDDDKNISAHDAEFNDAAIRAKLAQHGVTQYFCAEFSEHCRRIATEADFEQDSEIVTKALDNILNYGYFWNDSQPVKMFVGPHGSGKTTTLIKTALAAKMRNIPTVIITTDNVRPCAVGELKAFADILGGDFKFADSPTKLNEEIAAARNAGQTVLIDTCGINPYLPDDAARLRQICNVADCDKILTLDAGYNAEDAVIIAGIFADMGANWLFPTKLDITRKIGAVLSAAAVKGLRLAYAGVGAKIAGGLATVNARSLARLLTE